MSGFEIVLLAVGLAMDAFAVSVAKAPCIGPKEQYKKVVLPFLEFVSLVLISSATLSVESVVVVRTLICWI